MSSKFLTDLDIQSCPTDESLWQLDKPLVYESDLMGKVEVPAGFFTDLASVPRVPFVYVAWGNRQHRAAILHDYAYRIDSKPQFTYRQANKIFREAMEATGASAKIRWPMWMGVFLGGWTSYHKKKVDWKPSDTVDCGPPDPTDSELIKV